MGGIIEDYPNVVIPTAVGNIQKSPTQIIDANERRFCFGEEILTSTQPMMIVPAVEKGIVKNWDLLEKIFVCIK